LFCFTEQTSFWTNFQKEQLFSIWKDDFFEIFNFIERKIKLNERFYWTIVQWESKLNRWKMKDNLENKRTQFLFYDWKKRKKWVVYENKRTKWRKKQTRPSVPTVLDKKTNLNKIFSLTSRHQIDYEKQLVAKWTKWTNYTRRLKC